MKLPEHVSVWLQICVFTDVTHYISSYRVLGSIVAFLNDAWSHQPGNTGAGEQQVCPSVGKNNKLSTSQS